MIRYIPGFRSDTTWKKVVAALYYLMAFLAFFGDLAFGVFMLSIPFFVFNLIDLFRIKKKGIPASKVVIPFALSFILIFSILVYIGGSGDYSQEAGAEPQESIVAQDNSEEDLQKEEHAIEQEPEIDDEIASREEDKDEEEKKAERGEEQRKLEEVKKQEEEEKKKQEEEAKAKVEGELKVHFLDVGQGDSALIMAGSNAMLIDAGDRGYGPGIVSYLKNQGVKKLDYLILTHPHADHIGGAADVVKAFEIGKIIMPKVAHTTNTYVNLLETIDNKGMKITTARAGDEYDLGSAKFKILAPNSSSYKSLNDYSVVTRIVFGNTAFLFTGDAESTSESQILSKVFEIKSDVLKVGHHGSDTSTSDSFLKSVSPKYAVISVGRGNKYGHPTQLVLGRLQNQGVEVYRTDEAGTIVATSDGEKITFDKKASSIAKSSTTSGQSNKSNQNSKGASTSTPTKTKQETAQPKKETSPTPAPETDNKEEVYITNTGSKYHKGNCRHLKSSKIPISLDKAKADGYEPCKVCRP